MSASALDEISAILFDIGEHELLEELLNSPDPEAAAAEAKLLGMAAMLGLVSVRIN